MIKINLPYHDDEVYAIYYSKDKILYRNSNFDDSNKAKIIVLVCDDSWLSKQVEVVILKELSHPIWQQGGGVLL